MKINDYIINDKVNEKILIDNKFRKFNGHFTRSYYLYKNFIKVTIMIDLDCNYFGSSVCDTAGNLYPPFYNLDNVESNTVAIEVINTYNNTMDDLVKRKILSKAHKNKNDYQSGSTIKIKYTSNKIKRLGYIEGAKSDWVDLRAAENVKMKKGEFRLISLGVAMELPEGYEAHVVPRSSTFKNFGIIQTNHMGVIDESYCGDNDVWKFPALAVRDTEIHVNDRICQFRIVNKMDRVNFEEVANLKKQNRGGFGTTGKC